MNFKIFLFIVCLLPQSSAFGASYFWPIVRFCCCCCNSPVQHPVTPVDAVPSNPLLVKPYSTCSSYSSCEGHEENQLPVSSADPTPMSPNVPKSHVFRSLAFLDPKEPRLDIAPEHRNSLLKNYDDLPILWTHDPCLPIAGSVVDFKELSLCHCSVWLSDFYDKVGGINLQRTNISKEQAQFMICSYWLHQNISQIKNKELQQFMKYCSLYLASHLEDMFGQDYSGWLEQMHKTKKAKLYEAVYQTTLLLADWVALDLKKKPFAISRINAVYMEVMCAKINALIAISFRAGVPIKPIEL